MDTNFLLVNSMYFMHVVVWSFGDFYFYKLVKLLVGSECAIFTTMVSMTNETVNRYVSHTSMNGVEGNLVLAALYFFHKLDKPRMFDRNLNCMTLLITICFITRSSSLAAWIPLAVLKIVEDYNFFLPILVAGLTVTVPAIVISTLIDSYYYGALTSPQINFVHVNVVENLSKFFGIEPWYFYLSGLKEEFCTIWIFGLFGICYFTVQQVSGSLKPYHKKKKYNSKIPGIFLYLLTYILILSMVDHKERRFYAPVAQLGCFAQGYAYTQFWKVKKIRPVLKHIFTTIMVVDGIKLFYALKFYTGMYHSMLEPYLVFNGRYDKL